MARLLLAIWLGGFAIQATDVLTVVAPDGCTDQTSGSATDPCQDGCPRCLCCARAAMFVSSVVTLVAGPLFARADVPSPISAATSPIPHAIFHVPKLV